MKKSTVELIEKKFKDDIWKIRCKIKTNKYEIKELAQKQNELKQTEQALYEILRLIK